MKKIITGILLLTLLSCSSKKETIFAIYEIGSPMNTGVCRYRVTCITKDAEIDQPPDTWFMDSIGRFDVGDVLIFQKRNK